MLHGGCFCGAVRFEITGAPYNATLCHCNDCRRIAGSPSVAWFSAGTADFRFTTGAPRGFGSSPGVQRSFCADCGTPLTYQRNDLPGEIDITLCSLDDPESIPPRDHTYTSRRLHWLNLADGLPEFMQARIPRR